MTASRYKTELARLVCQGQTSGTKDKTSDAEDKATAKNMPILLMSETHSMICWF